MRLLRTYALLLGALVCATASAADGDGAFRTGRLANGLTYYVRHTGAEPGMAGFYLVQNVGSLMEEDNQKGLAHFLEHMAFNASQNFPGQIDLFLNSRGITHYNAYTAQDETVYNIDDVPAHDTGLVDSCLLVLRDWCHFLTFPEKGIAKERGIVLEEWRTRRDAVARAREKVVGALYNDSRYSTRETIGDRKVLETFTRAELVDYYDRWYRPDLQAVIAVGDIDAERVEGFIRERFADIPAPEHPQPRPVYGIETAAEPRYVLVTDPELGGVSMEFTQRFAQPGPAATPEELIRRITVRDYFNRMIAARVARLATAEEPLLYDASIEYEQLVRGYDALTISLAPYPGKDFRALYEVYRIWEAVRRLGFTAREFEAQRRQMLRQAEGFGQHLDRIGYGVYATLFQNHFLLGTPIVEPAQRGELVREALASITPEEVNDWVKSWAQSGDNRVFMITGSDAAYDYLTLDDILEAEQAACESEPEQPEFTAETTSLIDFPLAEAPVVRERRLKVGDAVEWSFANGARVVFKRADEGLGRFSVEAVSEGGLSLVADDDIPSAKAVGQLAFASGVYNTDRSAMIALMQNHDIEIGFRIGSRRETISGEALNSEADLFFELFHLGLTRPRFDESEFARYTNEMLISLAARRPSPLDRAMDSMRMLFAKPSPRNPRIDSAYVARIDPARVKTLFRERFCNPGDFVFYLAGDLSEAEARHYAAQYIGTLPAVKGPRERAAKRPSEGGPESVTRVFTVEMPDDKASVDLAFSNDRKFDRRQAVAFWLAGTILNSRCKAEIRERRGGSYSIDVGTRYNDEADPRGWLTVHFETGADRVDEMKEAFYREWHDLLRDGVTDEDVASIVAAQKRSLEARPKDTAYWLNVLYNYIEKGEDQTRADYHAAVLDAMTPREVQRVANLFWKDARRMDIVIKAAPRNEQKQHNE